VHAIYAEDAVLDYPQSGERFRGRSRIQAAVSAEDQSGPVAALSASSPGAGGGIP
jgi:hypothetical protein